MLDSTPATAASDNPSSPQSTGCRAGTQGHPKQIAALGGLLRGLPGSGPFFESLRPSMLDTDAATAPTRWGWFSPAEPSVTYEYQHGWKTVRLDEPLHYHTPGGRIDTAPAGLHTDGASIPWVLAPLAGQRLSGPHLLAAFVHDALCARARALGGPAGLTLRRYADSIFPSMVRAAGGGWWSAWSKGRAVRLGTLATRLRGDWRRSGA